MRNALPWGGDSLLRWNNNYDASASIKKFVVVFCFFFVEQGRVQLDVSSSTAD